MTTHILFEVPNQLLSILRTTLFVLVALFLSLHTVGVENSTELTDNKLKATRNEEDLFTALSQLFLPIRHIQDIKIKYLENEKQFVLTVTLGSEGVKPSAKRLYRTRYLSQEDLPTLAKNSVVYSEVTVKEEPRLVGWVFI